MKRTEFLADITRLVAELIPTIGDEYRASEDDTEPSMMLTIGADNAGWSYQTGDNSYSGGAYSYATWGIGYLTRESVPADVAANILSDLEDNETSPAEGNDALPIFTEWFSTSSGRIELQLSLSDAESASQPGKDASEDIEALRRLPYIAKQLDAIDADLLRSELREYGAWDDAESADHEKNLDRILWIACGDISDSEAAR